MFEYRNTLEGGRNSAHMPLHGRSQWNWRAFRRRVDGMSGMTLVWVLFLRSSASRGGLGLVTTLTTVLTCRCMGRSHLNWRAFYQRVDGMSGMTLVWVWLLRSSASRGDLGLITTPTKIEICSDNQEFGRKSF